MGEKKAKSKIKSRKLWVTIGTVLAGAAYPPLIPLLKIITPIYLGAQGAADAAEALAEGLGRTK